MEYKENEMCPQRDRQIAHQTANNGFTVDISTFDCFILLNETNKQQKKPPKNPLGSDNHYYHTTTRLRCVHLPKSQIKTVFLSFSRKYYIRYTFFFASFSSVSFHIKHHKAARLANMM